MLACENGFLEIVRVLVARGGKINDKVLFPFAHTHTHIHQLTLPEQSRFFSAYVSIGARLCRHRSVAARKWRAHQ
jgi:hypothetical protein